jgi:hypothetical protein
MLTVNGLYKLIWRKCKQGGLEKHTEKSEFIDQLKTCPHEDTQPTVAATLNIKQYHHHHHHRRRRRQ